MFTAVVTDVNNIQMQKHDFWAKDRFLFAKVVYPTKSKDKSFLGANVLAKVE